MELQKVNKNELFILEIEDNVFYVTIGTKKTIYKYDDLYKLNYFLFKVVIIKLFIINNEHITNIIKLIINFCSHPKIYVIISYHPGTLYFISNIKTFINERNIILINESFIIKKRKYIYMIDINLNKEIRLFKLV
jgi:hypothetical protein